MIVTSNFKNSMYPRSFVCAKFRLFVKQGTFSKKQLCKIGKETIWKSRFTSFFNFCCIAKYWNSGWCKLLIGNVYAQYSHNIKDFILTIIDILKTDLLMSKILFSSIYLRQLTIKLGELGWSWGVIFSSSAYFLIK